MFQPTVDKVFSLILQERMPQISQSSMVVKL
jgi:hypothetical protein